MFNISTFQNNISKYGYLTEDKFEVIITPPPFMKNNLLFLKNLTDIIGYNDISNTLRFRVSNVTTPDTNITTTDVHRYGIGPRQKNPTVAIFSDINMNFISDGYGNLWQFFYQWNRAVFQFNGTSLGGGGSAANYTSLYKDDFGTIVQIINYDLFGNAIQTTTLNAAYPILLKGVEFNWESKKLLKIDLSLTFTDWLIEGSTLVTANT